MIRLGRIVIAAGVSKNNTNTVAPFNIPATTRGLYLLASGDGLRYVSKPDSAATPATNTPTVPGTSAVAAAATDFPLTGSIAFGEVTGPPGAPLVVAAWNTTGGSLNLDVFAVTAN